MSSRETLIRDYFSAGAETYWRWQDDGAAIAWSDGKTIAFVEEMAAVLNHMAPYGLPRFGSLLLLVAATRKNWAVDGREAGLLSGILKSAFNIDQSATTRRQELELLQNVLNGLHKVRALDSSLRSPMKAKAALVELVFDGRKPHAPPGDASAIVEAVRPGLLALLERSPLEGAPQFPASGVELMQDLAELASGLERLSPEAVRLRMETGLESLPLPAPVEELEEELAACEAARRLIHELRDSPEYGGLAQIAQRLLASATLPRRLDETDEQETGGFSDIANRGTPDRLLLSELAQDDLTLAVRVAMNEAMYLHREVPPSTPRVRRELLIDSGVHAWGTPRVFAAAAALALAASTPSTASLRVWRGSAAAINEVDLTTADGLRNHLSVLEAEPSLAGAMPEFGNCLQEPGEPAEAVLLMPAESLADDALTRSLRELPAQRLFIATVARDGEFRLVERRVRGEKVLRQMRLDLADLLNGGPRLIEKRADEQLPAIFRESRLPLRMPHQLEGARSWFLESWGALTLTRDGRLMRWTDHGRGAIQLSDAMPQGALCWSSSECVQGRTQFIVGNSSRFHLVNLDIVRCETEVIPLESRPTSGFVKHNGALMMISGAQVHVLSETTGENIDTLQLPTYLEHHLTRYFSRRGPRRDARSRWCALSHDGQSVTLDPVPIDAGRKHPEDYVDMWDVAGVDGPMVLNASGVIFDLLEGKIRTRCAAKIPLYGARLRCNNWRLRWASPDGKCVGIECEHSGSPHKHRVNLDADQVEQDYPAGVDQRVAQLVRQVSCRNRFGAMGLEGSGLFYLRDRKGRKFVVTTSHAQVNLKSMPGGGDRDCETPFEPIEDHPYGFRLSEARWPDGSRAVLDSRGLLHLMPVDKTISEVSLVLEEGELTGWCNAAMFGDEEGFFGKAYFASGIDAPTRRRAVAGAVLERVIAPFVEGIRAAT